ncbi:MAG: MFS transporter [Burkholderiales bacterium]
MASDPDNSTSHNGQAARANAKTITIYQIIGFVLPWNTAYKASRVLNTLFALELGATPLQTGLLLATYGLFPMLFAAYAGKVADRHGVRIPLYIGLVLLGVGIALPFAWPTFSAMFVSALVGGAGFILSQVAMQTLTGSLGVGEARTKNFSLYVLTVAVADFLGPVLAGFSIDAFGHVPTFAISASLTLVSLAGFVAIDRLIPRARARTTDAGTQRMSDLLRQKDLRHVLVASAVTMTAGDLFQLYVPLYGHSIGLSASAIGLVMGAAAVAVFVTRTLIPPLSRWLGEERLLLYSLFIVSSMFVAIPFFKSGIVLAALCFVLGLGLGLGQPLTVILAYNRSPAGRAGEVVGVRIAVNNLMHVVMPPLFGAIGSLVGLAPVLWVSAGVLSLGAYFTRLEPRTRNN